MSPIHPARVARSTGILLWMLLFLCLSFASNSFASMAYPPALDQGYRDLYNLDFPGAHAVFQQYSARHPDEPLPVVSDAAAYLFSEFDRLHIIDVQLFADQSRFDNRSKLTPDPAVRKAFDDRTTHAAQLADAALKRNPQDVAALYSKTCISGMRSDYALLIEKRDLAALNLSKEASAFSKQVLAADSTMFDAYLASGVENYMLSLKPAPIRWILGATGAGTDKEEGIRLLRITAANGHYLAPFARMMLAVAALRDNHPKEAKATLIALSKEYPRNSLYQREIARIP
ncbi:hypothetical protein [Granulicella arctica]|uniref:Uncharacterized protein n=1 Tax=Granulicella arctica TaxID=940613 RepID=A0A7Y9PF55_9BACT|nr:hypothetical protein [Granulicella arctica]NYF78033.1 hypothetical protein [Granulicella arctica]